MPSPKTDSERSAAGWMTPSVIHRLNVRLVVSLALVSLIALTVSGLAINQILPGYFSQQAAERLQGAALSTSLLIQEVADAEREEDAGTLLAEELRNTHVYQVAARLSAGRIIAATVTILNDRDQQVAVAGPGSVDDLTRQGFRLDPTVQPYRTGLIPLFLDQERQLSARYRIVLDGAYTSRESTLAQIRGTLVAAGLIALLGSLLVGVVVAARLTGPISALRRVAARVSQGQFDERATASGVLEIDELAAQFNVMADRLAGALRVLEADRDRLREFVADVSHELRTPVAALRLYTELQRDGQVDDATRAEFLERSAEQIGRLEWMSTNLLDLSRIDAGIFPLDVRSGDLRDPIRVVVEAHSEVAERRGISLSSEVPAAAVELRFDRERIIQLLTNLVGNALKFTPRSGSVSIRLTEGEHEARGATIEVRDTGPGIPADELPRIFERFYRGTSIGEARASGSGLGLAIVRSIVEMHGGRVHVSSVVGEGTVFSVELPSTWAPDAPDEPMPAAEHADQG